MNSIFLYTPQRSGISELAPWKEGEIGVRRRVGGLHFLPWGGFMPRDWLPSQAKPVALAVTSWGVGLGRGQTENNHRVSSGFIVGAVIGGRAWAVLYDGRIREA